MAVDHKAFVHRLINCIDAYILSLFGVRRDFSSSMFTDPLILIIQV